MNGYVNAIAIDGSGNVYAGGNFTTAGGSSANYIAKWGTGGSWSALGNGVNNCVNAIAINSNGDIYVGGYFTKAGGSADANVVNHAAKYSGSTWSSLNSGTTSGVNDAVYAFGIMNSNLIYIGGSFTQASGATANCIAKYTPSTSTLSAITTSGIIGADSAVYAMVMLKSELYVGGSFLTIGGVTVNYIGKYTLATHAWSALGTGLNGYVKALATDGTNLYAGGYFGATADYGTPLSYVAKWNGTSWSALGTGLNSYVNALAVDASGNVYAGGYFSAAGGTALNYVGKFSGGTWTGLGSGTVGVAKSGSQAYVNAIAIDGSGNVYAGGNFTTAGGNPANYIAEWGTGGSWSAFNSGVNNCVNAIALNGGNMYVGGYFTTAGGSTTVNHVAVCVLGTLTWSALNTGTVGVDNSVRTLAFMGSDLYVGGDFTTAGGITVNRIAKYTPGANPPTTGTWAAMNTGTDIGANNSVYALTTYTSPFNDIELYAGGNFNLMKGLSSGFFAKYARTVAADVGTASTPTTVAAVCDTNYNDLHIILTSTNVTTALLYRRFDMSTNSFGAIQTLSSGLTSQPIMMISGTTLSAYWTASSTGTNYTKNGAITETSTTWDANPQVVPKKEIKK